MFLEYLVTKKIISVEEALIGKIEQIESMPSLLRVFKNDNLFSDETLYGFLLKSQKENRSIYEVIKDKSGLTDSDLEQVILNQNNLSRSLGDILIKKGLISKEKFDEALRDYSSHKSAEKESAPMAIEVSDNGGGGISAAALESLKAINNVDESTLSELEQQVSSENSEEGDVVEIEENDQDFSLDEYFDYYDEGLQSELFVVANRFRLKGRPQDLELLHEGVLRVLTLVKLNKFSIQEKLLGTYENIMSKVLNDAIELDDTWKPLPSDMLEILWEIRKALFEGKTEASALAHDNLKDKYLNNLKSLIEFTKR